eukprot:360598-Chlamydomonas_euryale.AAC.10
MTRDGCNACCCVKARKHGHASRQEHGQIRRDTRSRVQELQPRSPFPRASPHNAPLFVRLEVVAQGAEGGSCAPPPSPYGSLQSLPPVVMRPQPCCLGAGHAAGMHAGRADMVGHHKPASGTGAPPSALPPTLASSVSAATKPALASARLHARLASSLANDSSAAWRVRSACGRKCGKHV